MEEVEQPNVNGSAKFGKFKDAESLMKAYSNLEAEFTKKSQRLAELESENEQYNQQVIRQNEIEREVEEFITKFEIAKPFKSAIKENMQKGMDAGLSAFEALSSSYKSASDYATDSEFLNNYVYNNEDIKNKIIKEYLSKLTQNSAVKLNLSSGNIPLTPPNVPTTIKEAGALARSIIKQK